jgi:hypothetical protein
MPIPSPVKVTFKSDMKKLHGFPRDVIVHAISNVEAI